MAMKPLVGHSQSSISTRHGYASKHRKSRSRLYNPLTSVDWYEILLAMTKTDKQERKLQPVSGIEPDWFTLPEHARLRDCVCFCGGTFQSQARKIQFLDRVTKNGQEETVTINGCLSKIACPNCGRNRIESFE